MVHQRVTDRRNVVVGRAVVLEQNALSKQVPKPDPEGSCLRHHAIRRGTKVALPALDLAKHSSVRPTRLANAAWVKLRRCR